MQSYNTLLSLSHLAAESDGVALLHNEALQRIAHRMHGIARPSFADMNAVAAQVRALATEMGWHMTPMCSKPVRLRLRMPGCT